ncbi:MAG: ATP synthase F1 subunit delta [Clostridia bacterium]|nr:ATP synthase F1 subunit delta [Clostridia bacterium]
MSAIGNEYGNALFLLAKEEGTLDEVATALIECDKLLEENPEYADFLETPSIPLEERIGAVRAAFDGNMPSCIPDFISLLIERGYVRYFSDCAEEFELNYNREFDISVAEVVSAKPLSVAERQELRDTLQAKTGRRIKLNCTVDPELVGGLVVKIDGRLYDGSIRTRITDILEEMTK